MVLILRLPKDVRSIVYRYLFDYNYQRLMGQYRSVWLVEAFMWSVDEVCFVSKRYPMLMANWRSLDELTKMSLIYGFASNSVGQKVPRRYVYSAGACAGTGTIDTLH